MQILMPSCRQAALRAFLSSLSMPVGGGLHALDVHVGHVHARELDSRMYLAMPGDLSGPTPARMYTFSCTPSSRTLSMNSSKRVHVVDELGLDEVGAGGDLLGQPVGAPLEGIAEGVGGGADEEARLAALDLVTALEAAARRASL